VTDSPPPAQAKGPTRPSTTLPMVAVLAMLASGSLLVGELLAQRRMHAAEEKALAQVDAAAATVTQQTFRLFESAEELSKLLRLRRRMLAVGNEASVHAVEAQLGEEQASSGFGIVNVEDIGTDGNRRWSTGEKGGRDFHGDRPYFAALRDAYIKHKLQPVYVGSPWLGQSSQHLRLRFARVLTSANGDWDGVVEIVIDPLVLSAQLASLRAVEGSFSSVLRLEDGQVVANSVSPATYLLHTLPPPPDELKLLHSTIAGHMRRPSPATGRDLLIGYRRIGDLPLVAVAASDADVELEPARQEQHLIRATSVVLAILCLGSLVPMLLFASRRQSARALAVARREIDAVETARAELERLIAGLPMGVFHGDVSAEGVFTRRYMTPSTAAVTGWARTDLPDTHAWAERMDPEAARTETAFLRRLLREGEASREYRMRRPDGRWVWVRDRVRVVSLNPDGGGEVIGTFTDLTSERALAAQTAMAAKLATLGELATGLAHELNQPVTVISLAAENALASLADLPNPSPEVQSALRHIAGEASKAGEIIDHLRLFGRRDTAPDQSPSGPVRLSSVLRGTMALVGGPLRDAGIDLRVDVSADLPNVMGRLVPSEQVLVNLCMNARDAMLDRPEDSRSLEIAAVAEADVVRLRVTDTGGGIPAHIMPRLFEPFVTTKGDHGAGLGLSICHGLMRSFGGDIVARNVVAPDGAMIGAEFILTFAIAPARLPVIAA
jgi:C4-dicarboxylate-specific signal transduction histidine kinase